MSNQELAQLLRNVAAALTIKGENRFRIIAYEKAADSIEHLTSEVKDLWEEGKLEEIPGIGKTLGEYIDELFRTGKVRHFESVFKGLSPALFELLFVPGLGPKRAYQLTKEFNITSPNTAIEKLEKIAKEGKIALLDRWGEKSQQEVLQAIGAYRRGQIKENRMALPYADTLAQELIVYLKEIKEVSQIEALGSLRRKVATIGDIDLAAATNAPEKVIEHFVRYPNARKVIDRGPKGASVLLTIGRQVDLRVAKPDQFGAMLQYFTGSKHHNIHLREYALKKGLSLSEYGIKNLKSKKLKHYRDEKTFYHDLGLDFIPPEMREDAGEIEASLNRQLPVVVDQSQIRGDLHIHSNYNLEPSHDLGVSSLQELLDTAVTLGYEYIGISDHNPSASNHTDNQIISILKRRKNNIEQIYSSWKKRVQSSLSADKQVHLFTMLEIDIDVKGNLSIPDAATEYLDAFIVSVHSSFNLGREQITNRILSGLSHPKAKILGHPTGRLLGSRESYDADWDKIFSFCNSHNKALEINSWPERLDLPDRQVHDAVKSGVKLVINTDAHFKDQMRLITYGVGVARRGWATRDDILNTLEYNKFADWVLKP